MKKICILFSLFVTIGFTLNAQTWRNTQSKWVNFRCLLCETDSKDADCATCNAAGEYIFGRGVLVEFENEQDQIIWSNFTYWFRGSQVCFRDEYGVDKCYDYTKSKYDSVLKMKNFLRSCQCGASEVPWTGITGKPPGFADDVDNVGENINNMDGTWTIEGDNGPATVCSAPCPDIVIDAANNTADITINEQTVTVCLDPCEHTMLTSVNASVTIIETAGPNGGIIYDLAVVPNNTISSTDPNVTITPTTLPDGSINYEISVDESTIVPGPNGTATITTTDGNSADVCIAPCPSMVVDPATNTAEVTIGTETITVCLDPCEHTVITSNDNSVTIVPTTGPNGGTIYDLIVPPATPSNTVTSANGDITIIPTTNPDGSINYDLDIQLQDPTVTVPGTIDPATYDCIAHEWGTLVTDDAGFVYEVTPDCELTLVECPIYGPGVSCVPDPSSATTEGAVTQNGTTSITDLGNGSYEVLTNPQGGFAQWPDIYYTLTSSTTPPDVHPNEISFGVRLPVGTTMDFSNIVLDWTTAPCACPNVNDLWLEFTDADNPETCITLTSGQFYEPPEAGWIETTPGTWCVDPALFGTDPNLRIKLQIVDDGKVLPLSFTVEGGDNTAVRLRGNKVDRYCERENLKDPTKFIYENCDGLAVEEPLLSALDRTQAVPKSQVSMSTVVINTNGTGTVIASDGTQGTFCMPPCGGGGTTVTTHSDLTAILDCNPDAPINPPAMPNELDLHNEYFSQGWTAWKYVGGAWVLEFCMSCGG